MLSEGYEESRSNYLEGIQAKGAESDEVATSQTTI